MSGWQLTLAEAPIIDPEQVLGPPTGGALFGRGDRGGGAHDKAPAGFAPLAIGLALVMIHLVSTP
jgi:hypothetical protein